MLFPELPEEEARQVLETLHKEAKAAGVGVGKEREKRDRSSSRDGPPNKRARDERRGNFGRDERRGNRDFGRDRG